MWNIVKSPNRFFQNCQVQMIESVSLQYLAEVLSGMCDCGTDFQAVGDRKRFVPAR